MSALPSQLRHAVLPELPLLAVGVIAIATPAMRDAIAGVPYVGVVAGVVAVLVAALTRQPRAAMLGVMVAVVPALMTRFADDPDAVAVLALAVLANCAVIVALRAGASPARVIAWAAGLVALEMTAIVTAAEPDPGLGAMVRTPILPLSWGGALPVPDIAAITALLLMPGAAIMAWWRRDTTARAIAWIVPLLVIGLGPEPAPAAAVGTALLLVATLVSGTHALAYRDALTGLPGRRAFDEAFAAVKVPFAVAVVDVDHFKRVNDTHGHDVGDQVLCMVAEQLGAVGAGGRAFRVGGEEFAILFGGVRATEVEPALNTLREVIEATPFRLRGPDRPRHKPKVPRRRRSAPQLAVTVSIGIAEAIERPRSVKMVLDAADQALYRAKEAGRNRVLRARRREYRDP